MNLAVPSNGASIVLATDPMIDSANGEAHARALAARLPGSVLQVAYLSGSVAAAADYREVILKEVRSRSPDLVVTSAPANQSAWTSTCVANLLLEEMPAPLLLARTPVDRACGHIVIASDFSHASRPALDTALRWFRDAQHTLFHAYPPPDGSLSDADTPIARWGVMARARCDQFLAVPPSGAFEPFSRMARVFEYGRPEHRVPAFVEKNHADLLVLGTHGLGRTFHDLVGSTAKSLARQVRCSVLVVRRTLEESARPSS